MTYTLCYRDRNGSNKPFHNPTNGVAIKNTSLATATQWMSVFLKRKKYKLNSTEIFVMEDELPWNEGGREQWHAERAEKDKDASARYNELLQKQIEKREAKELQSLRAEIKRLNDELNAWI